MINLAIYVGRESERGGGGRERERERESIYWSIHSRCAGSTSDTSYCERIPRHINNYYTHGLLLYFPTRRRLRPRWMSTTSPRMYSNPKGCDRPRATTFSARSRISYCPSDVGERFMWLYFVFRRNCPSYRITFFRDRSQQRIIHNVLRELISIIYIMYFIFIYIKFSCINPIKIS